MNSSPDTTRILGIDPGFGRVGFAVIEDIGNEWKTLSYGCIETAKNTRFVDRLDKLNKSLTKIIDKYNPNLAAVEDLFFYKNVKTAIKVGQARGVILLTLRQAKIEIDEFTPLQIKQAVTGYGHAKKKQIQYMVAIQLGLKTVPKQDDAADALAVALTCAHSMKLKKIMNIQ
ncbi:MAG: crossover junction endodeoxyribonuclease RuvC [Candidatus Magasanikbacteria bacterium]|nr:crossover junction endodeoxyribonuclease RuvC [Candidatus Magasanikbacteria bacterium]